MTTPEQAKKLAASGVVVGMKALTGDDKPVPRVDIDVLLTTQPDTFNLFLQALGRMQKDKGLLSYYSIAGIHGLPSTSWDGVGIKGTGYCAHGELIFPTWHRSYLALIEQTIYLNMIKIAEEYDAPHRQKYLNAARVFRFPYLDYFRPRDDDGVTFNNAAVRGGKESAKYNFRLPDIFNVNSVNVRAPPLDQITPFENPLYSYRFRKEVDGQLPDNDWTTLNREQVQGRQWPFLTTQTVRHPDNPRSTSHNLSNLSDSLNKGCKDRNRYFRDLIDSEPYKNLQTVASDAPTEGSLTSGSIEGFHGNYHWLFGGPGHMSHPSVAAFDPIFWFHHAQIDRVWALWQGYHPDKWFPLPKRPEDAKFAEGQKALRPFYKTRTGPGSGTFYNSDDTRYTESFGYIYDDFIGLDKARDKVQELKNRIFAKYDWQTSTPNSRNTSDAPDQMKPLNKLVRSSYFFTTPTPSVTAPSGKIHRMAALATFDALQVAETATVSFAVSQVPTIATLPKADPPKIDPTFDREWYIDSVIKRSAANGPFTIYFFLAPQGEVHNDPKLFDQSPYLIGFNHIFVAPSEICDNCGDLEAVGQLSSDTTPITSHLLDYLAVQDNGLDSLRPEHVKDFLVKYLRWRVVFNGGIVHDPRELARIADLSLNVSAKIYHDDGSKTYEMYPDVIEKIKVNASATAST